MISWVHERKNSTILICLLSEMIPKWPTGCFRLLPRDIASNNLSVAEVTRKSETWRQVKTSFYLVPQANCGMPWREFINAILTAPRRVFLITTVTLREKNANRLLSTRVGDIAFYPKLGHKITFLGLCPSYYIVAWTRSKCR